MLKSMNHYNYFFYIKILFSEVFLVCSQGPDSLTHELAVKTKKVIPIPSEDLPGIVINGIHSKKMTEDAFDDLTGLVCDLYTRVKPKECQKSSKIDMGKIPEKIQKNGLA